MEGTERCAVAGWRLRSTAHSTSHRAHDPCCRRVTLTQVDRLRDGTVSNYSRRLVRHLRGVCVLTVVIATGEDQLQPGVVWVCFRTQIALVQKRLETTVAIKNKQKGVRACFSMCSVLRQNFYVRKQSSPDSNVLAQLSKNGSNTAAQSTLQILLVTPKVGHPCALVSH